MTEQNTIETTETTSAQAAPEAAAGNALAGALTREALLRKTENGGTTYASEAIDSPWTEVFYAAGSFRPEVLRDARSLREKNAKLRAARGDTNRLLGAFIRGLEETEGKPEAVYGPRLALLIRDIAQGSGERALGRVLFRELLDRGLVSAEALFSVLGRQGYGRWDDLVFLARETRDRKAARLIEELLIAQLRADERLLTEQGSEARISLLAKWMPSISTSSRFTRRNAARFANLMKLDKRSYRKLLSRLRRQLEIVEQKVCAREWDRIDYSRVPSLASLKYAEQFRAHDGKRYGEFLTAVEEGRAKVNAKALTAPEIAGRVWDAEGDAGRALEALWKALPKLALDRNVLPVCDVSGSMYTGVGRVMAIDVARGLSLYLAENNRGAFRNLVLSFSENCRAIRMEEGEGLRSRMEKLDREVGYNTDVERVLALLLRMCREEHVAEADLPILVFFSDMEFDQASGVSDAKPLFDEYRRKFNEIGLPFPRVVFWNICNRTKTVPMKENEAGLVLASGFSEKIMQGLLAGRVELQSPWEVLKDMLDAPRYAMPFG